MVTRAPSGEVYDIECTFVKRDGEKSVTVVVDGRKGALTLQCEMEYLGEWKQLPPDAHGKKMRVRVSQSTAKDLNLFVFRIPGVKTKDV